MHVQIASVSYEIQNQQEKRHREATGEYPCRTLKYKHNV